MAKHLINVWILLIIIAFSACGKLETPTEKANELEYNETPFEVLADTFADIEVLRYKVNGFDNLTLTQKKLCYYLTEAGLAGRDLIYAQNYAQNISVRRLLETIIENKQRFANDPDFKAIEVYAKRFWFSNGMHHHYSGRKFIPSCRQTFFEKCINKLPDSLVLNKVGITKTEVLEKLVPTIFSPSIATKKTSKDANTDLIASSAVNFYMGVSQKEAEYFYDSLTKLNPNSQISHGLNSRLSKINGQLVEEKWYLGGLYREAITKIIYWLNKATEVAENPNQKASINKLIEYYRTGELQAFDEHSVLWVSDTASEVDFINGFIEVYADPMGLKGSYESVVSIRDQMASKQMAALAANAQWFEDNSPTLPQHKKPNVKGVSYKVITVVGESGDAAPSTPVGINLPNARWIREQHGSKSVSLGNIKDAYEASAGKGATEEFFIGNIVGLIKNYGVDANRLHTALHEVIGHGSGLMEPNVASAKQALKNYGSTIEEARADLVALYYIIDPKLTEWGLTPSTDLGKAQYYNYFTNGLIKQLFRINEGEDLEEDHMRNRQLIAKYCLELGKTDSSLQLTRSSGKTYVTINNFDKLRENIGLLLREVQRITSQGDFEAAKNLVETYGVKTNATLTKEVKQRYRSINAKPYAGFVQPKLVPVYVADTIANIKIDYSESFEAQMLRYGKDYNFIK